MGNVAVGENKTATARSMAAKQWLSLGDGNKFLTVFKRKKEKRVS
jgi:hypothetical protein